MRKKRALQTSMATALAVLMVTPMNAFAMKTEQTYTIYGEDGYTATNKYSNPYDFNLPLQTWLKDQSPYSQTMDASTSGTHTATTDAKGNETLQFNEAVAAKATKTFGKKYLLKASIVDYEFTPDKVEGWDVGGAESQFLGDSPRIETSNLLIQSTANTLFDGLSAEEKKTPYAYTKKVFEFVQMNMNYTVDPRVSNKGAAHAVTYRVGNCEDYASFMVALLRAKNIPAKTVAGYSIPTNALTTNNLNPAPYAHMWVEAYFKGFGYVLFDPTIGLSTSKTITVKDRQGNNFLSNGSPVSISVRNSMTTPSMKTFGKNVNLYVRKEQDNAKEARSASSYLTITRNNFLRLTTATALDGSTGPAVKTVAFTKPIGYSSVPIDVDVVKTFMDGTKETVTTPTLSSSNENVAKVSTTGEVTFTGKTGATTISASVGTMTATQTVNVTRSIAIAETPKYGKTPQPLTASYQYPNGEKKEASDVSWTSSNPSVATIDDKGVVTYTGKLGSVSFTATDPETKATKVVSTNVTGALKLSGLSGYSKTPQPLKAEFFYATGDTRPVDVTWTSSNPSVATIDDKGVLTYTGVVGSTSVTATDKLSGLKTTATASVAATYGIKERPTFSVSKKEQQLSTSLVYSTKEEAVHATEWSSSNPAIATVSKDGLLTYTGKVGSATITAKNDVTKQTATLGVSVAGTFAMKEKLAFAGENGTQQLSTTFAYSTKESVDSNVTWTSSNPSVATVDDKGLVTYTGKLGSVTIMATHDVSGLKATNTLNVSGTFSIKEKLLFAGVDKTQQLLTSFAYSGKSASESKASWVSSNPAVATVDEKGLVTYTGKIGSVTITATNLLTGQKAVASLAVGATFRVNERLGFTGPEGTQQLSTMFAYTGKSAENAPVTWTSSNKEVANVDEKGLVTYTGNLGSVTISAVNGWTGQKVDVSTSVTGKTELSKFGYSPDAQRIKAELLYANGMRKELTAVWSSSNDAIATVDQTGLVTFSGKAGVVSISAQIGKTLLRTSVSVAPKLELKTPLVYQKEDRTLEGVIAYPTINSKHLVATDVTWTSSNAKVATVDGKGLLHFTGEEGSVSIKGVAVGYTATFTTNVTKTLTAQEAGTTFPSKLTPKMVYPDGSEIPMTGTTTFTSSNTRIATIDANGNIQKGVTKGTVTFTLKNGTKTGTVTFTVK